MPKNRNVKTDDAPPMGMHRFAIGLLLLLAAVIASGWLSLDHMGIFSMPGCGPDSGCARAAQSPFASVLGWPVAFAGFAFFCALLVGWWLSAKGISPAFKWLTRLGVVASVFYVGVMIVGGYLCPWCLSAHIANILFLIVVETAVTSRSVPNGRLAAVGGVTFAVASLGVGVTSYLVAEQAEAEANQDLDDSIAQMVQGNTEQRQESTSIPTRPAQQAAPPALERATSRDDYVVTLPAVAARTSDEGFTGRYRLGDEDAPVRLVIFSSYQCKDCARIERQAFRILQQRDDVSLSHKHFPLCKPCNTFLPEGRRDPHPNACWAARAAETAGILGGPEGFWEMHEWLFEVGGGFTDEEIAAQLRKMNYPVQEFLRIMQSPATLTPVQRDVEEGYDLGLRFTPMIFINGVQLRGWHAKDALIRAVERVAESSPPRLTPVADRPPARMEKFIEDWEKQVVQHRLGADTFKATLGPEDAPLKITMWLDLDSDLTQDIEPVLRSIVESRSDTNLTVRHFPLHEDCNFLAESEKSTHGCEMHRAVEAAGILGGNDAYWAMHVWLIENRESFTAPTIRERILGHAQSLGLDPDAFEETMMSEDVSTAIMTDAHFNKRQRQAFPDMGVPAIYVDGRWAPRWRMNKDTTVIQRIIERAAEDVANRPPPSIPQRR